MTPRPESNRLRCLNFWCRVRESDGEGSDGAGIGNTAIICVLIGFSNCVSSLYK